MGRGDDKTAAERRARAGGTKTREMVKCERQSIDTRALFVFIGAVPNTAWLAGTIELDDHGFIPAALYSMRR